MNLWGTAFPFDGFIIPDPQTKCVPVLLQKPKTFLTFWRPRRNKTQQTQQTKKKSGKAGTLALPCRQGGFKAAACFAARPIALSFLPRFCLLCVLAAVALLFAQRQRGGRPHCGNGQQRTPQGLLLCVAGLRHVVRSVGLLRFVRLLRFFGYIGVRLARLIGNVGLAGKLTRARRAWYGSAARLLPLSKGQPAPRF